MQRVALEAKLHGMEFQIPAEVQLQKPVDEEQEKKLTAHLAMRQAEKLRENQNGI